MDDRSLMENLLLLEKGACDLFMHGTLESENQNVKQTFSTALNESMNMQSNVYSEMSAKGWYPSQQVSQNKLDTTRQKFSMQS